MGWISLLLAMVAMALALPARASLSPLPMLRLDPPAGGPLLPCGTSGGKDASGDSRQALDVFDVVKGGVRTGRREHRRAGAELLRQR